MDHNSSFLPYTHCPPRLSSESQALRGSEPIYAHGHNLANSSYPLDLMSAMVSSSDSSNDPDARAINAGPFVAMDTSHYLGLQRRLRQVTEAASRGPGIGESVPIQPMSWTSAPAVDILEAQASEHVLFAPIDMRGSRKRRNHANGRKKVACNSCSDAHKKCDQGHPCGRCKSHGIEVCVYPLTKRAGRSTRRKGASFTTGEDSQEAVTSSIGHLPQMMGFTPFASPPTQIPLPPSTWDSMFQVNKSHDIYGF